MQSLALAGATCRHAIGFGVTSDVSMAKKASLRCRAEPTEGISVESIGDMLADVEPGAATDVDDFPRARLAVFVSGGGSNMRAIYCACSEGRVYGEIALVVSDKPGALRCAALCCSALPLITAAARGPVCLGPLSCASLADE